MTFVDLETGKRYSGRLEAEIGSHGHPEQLIVLTPVSKRSKEKERRMSRETFFGFLLIEATLDEVSRLDRAGYHLRLAKDFGGEV